MAGQNVLDPNVIHIVKQYDRRLRQDGITPEKLIVFGSRAKGTAKPWSDIDVCVVSPTFGNDRFSERVSLIHIRNDQTLDIEPHPYHPSDLLDKWDPLAHEIRTHGIKVV